METLFENNDFILKSTGHWYDFVGLIESKHKEPITFIFEEEDVEGLSEEHYAYYYDRELDLDESKCKLSAVYDGMDKEYAKEVDFNGDFGQCSPFTLNPFESVGFLSECQQRGWFLALIKHYCPEKLDRIAWA